MALDCKLFQGEAAPAVCPALPIKGVSIILGNKLAGAWMWSEASPSVAMDPVALSDQELDECNQDLTEVFTACVVMRAMLRSKTDVDPVSLSSSGKFLGNLQLPLSDFPLPLSDFPLSQSHSELVSEQLSDSSLSELFQHVKPDSEMLDRASGYFLQNSLLVRKWLDQKANVLGDSIIHVVLPLTFCEAVLKVAHNESGHSGVNKTYDRVLRHFFWPCVKKDVSTYIKTCHTCQLSEKNESNLKTCSVNSNSGSEPAV